MRCPYLRTGKSLLADMYGEREFRRRYVQFQLHLFNRSSILKQKRSHPSNIICDGSLLYGRLLPDYSQSTDSSVRLFIPGGLPDKAFARMISSESRAWSGSQI